MNRSRRDHAQPGPRLWDVAYAAYRWVPMTAPGNADGFGTTEEQATRLRLFCDRYGLGSARRAALIDALAARLRTLVDLMRAQAAGNAAFAGHLSDEHHLQYLTDAEYVLARRAVFEGDLRR